MDNAALNHLERAVRLAPDVPLFHLDLGRALRQHGNVHQALSSFERVLRLDPASAPAWLAMSESLLAIRELTPALDCLRQALLLEPDNLDARLLLAQVHRDTGDLEAAERNYRFVLQHQSRSVPAAVNLASLLRSRGAHAEAIPLLEGALHCEPHSPLIQFNLANALADCGRFEEARAAYEQSLENHPHPAKVFYNLTMITRLQESDRPRLNDWTRLAERSLTTVEDHIHLHFALGKALADLAAYDEAFGHYEQGNRLVRVDFDPAEYHAFIDRMLSTWSSDFIGTLRPIERCSIAPIFIVGMPRSGTTLVEQILAGHSQVRACGEREDLGRLVGDLAARLGVADHVAAVPLTSASAFEAVAEEYLKRLGSDGGCHWITDKLPANFLLIGWIAACFPRARILHCRRDPRDVCLSCYFQHFTGRLPFAYDLDHLVEYHRGYERLMQHWHEVLPGWIQDVEYEQVVERPEEIARTFVSFCGLPWESECLKTSETDRAIGTASLWQVRQPIHKSARGRWRRYQKQIGPLIRAFGVDDWPLRRLES